jgi:hypothetical protein
VSAEIPAFPPGTRGSVQLVTDEGGAIERDPARVGELPTNPQMFIAMLG